MKLHNNAFVTYETQIIEAGKIISRRPEKRNLLLDNGLDGIAVRSWWASFAYCVLGDGTTPTKRDSGAITVSISGEIATASAGFFNAGDVGRLIKLDSGQEVYIDSYTSDTVVSVAGAIDDEASEFTVWYVNELGHGNEIVRTSNLGVDSGDVSSTFDGTTIEHKRTFVFPIETVARTYKEIGWSHTYSSGGNLFGRDLIPGGGDSVSPGQSLKVVVKLSIVIGINTPQAVANIGTGGFNSSGELILATVNANFQGANSPFRIGSTGLFEAFSQLKLNLVKSNFTLPENTSSTVFTLSSLVDLDGSIAAYDAGSFSLHISGKFGTAQGVGTIYGLAIGRAGSGGYSLIYKFDTPQTKDSAHTLEIGFSQSWGRVLVN